MADATLLLPDVAPQTGGLEDVTANGQRVAWRLARRAGAVLANLALTATVTPSSTYSTFTVAAVNDSKYEATHLSAASPTYPFDYVVDFGTAATFDTLEYVNGLAGGNNCCIRAYAVAVSNNGTDWTDVASGEFDTGIPATRKIYPVTFASQTARYVRLRATSNWGGTYVACAELRVFAARTDLVQTATFYAPSTGGGSIADLRDRVLAASYYVSGYGSICQWDFSSVVAVDAVEWWTYLSGTFEPRTAAFYVSEDGATWTHAYTLERDYVGDAFILAIPFDTVHQARYLRAVCYYSGSAKQFLGGLFVEFRAWQAVQTRYDATSPTSEWEHDFGGSATLSGLVAAEDCDGAATLRYQWGLGAATNPALNGSWLTAAQLAAAVEGQAGRYLRMAVQFNSDGTDQATFRGLSVVAATSGGKPRIVVPEGVES